MTSGPSQPPIVDCRPVSARKNGILVELAAVLAGGLEVLKGRLDRVISQNYIFLNKISYADSIYLLVLVQELLNAGK